MVTLNSILIPVDFSLKTDLAIEKAVGLADGDKTELHLLHVVKNGHGPKHSFKLWEAEKNFADLQNKIKADHPSARVMTHVLQARSVQKMIIECVHLLKPDLIVIGKTDLPRRWFRFKGISSGAISRKSDCPVLTVKPGSVQGNSKVILLPIRDFLPERKLEWVTLLAGKYRARVHLLGMHNRHDTRKRVFSRVFLKAYNRLLDNLHQPVEYRLSQDPDAAEVTLSYAREIMADLILVDPSTNGGAFGLIGRRHLSDLVRRDSAIQVLDIEPYHK